MTSIRDLNIGGPAKGSSKQSDKAASSTEKELQRLRRIDLLELLLDEIRKNEENTARMKEAAELSDRLKARLDDKEAQVERLEAKLAEKDAEIARLLANNEALAHANGTLDVDELLKVQRLALEMYIQRVPELAELADHRARTSSAAHAAPKA